LLFCLVGVLVGLFVLFVLLVLLVLLVLFVCLVVYLLWLWLWLWFMWLLCECCSLSCGCGCARIRGGSIVNRGRHDAAPGLVVWLKMYDMRNGEVLSPGANWSCQTTAPVAAQTALSLPCPVAWPEGVSPVPVVSSTLVTVFRTPCIFA
jgi:hypothetical protein